MVGAWSRRRDCARRACPRGSSGSPLWRSGSRSGWRWASPRRASTGSTASTSSATSRRPASTCPRCPRSTSARASSSTRSPRSAPRCPVHAIGHPPGLLVGLHALGIDTAPGMAALTIGVGALSIPLDLPAGPRAAGRAARAARHAALRVRAQRDALRRHLGRRALRHARPARRAAARWPRRPDGRAPGRAGAGGAGAGQLLLLRQPGDRRAGHAAGLAAQRPAAGRAASPRPAASRWWPSTACSTWPPATTRSASCRPTESVYREGIASRRPYAFWVFGSPVAFLVAARAADRLVRAALRGRRRRRRAWPCSPCWSSPPCSASPRPRPSASTCSWCPLACLAAATSAAANAACALVLGALAAQALATELLFYTVW